jgi:anaerobic magnesium-protoporphyrin IX monomethyl ester cyclase
LQVLRAVKASLPHAITVYGGVYPTYHHADVLAQHPEVDLIVRGEGEATVVELVEALAQACTTGGASAVDLGRVRGIAWRRDGVPAVTGARPPIHDLDAFRIGWELVDDWDRYQAFGRGRAAVVQFSRGCPHTCTYCGQWMFWKRWRHRGVTRFVDEVERLHREHDVRFFWLADENPTTDRDIWRRVLEELSARHLPISLCASIRAQDIVRDADLLPLYRRAGFLYVLMGVEAATDDLLAAIRKRSSVNDGYQAVRLLRRHQIMSIVDYIVGIEEETPRSLWRGLRGLLHYDGDLVNVLYMTPHAWTPYGRSVADSTIIEPDLHKWDYRHQVIGVKHLSPTQLFLGVKIIEACYHLHPRRLARLLSAPDPTIRRQLRFSFRHTSAVFWHEIYEHFACRWRLQRDGVSGPIDLQRVTLDASISDR